MTIAGEHVKAAIERSLGGRVTEREWRYLSQELGLVRAFLCGSRSALTDAVHAIRTGRGVFSADAVPNRVTPDSPKRRRVANDALPETIQWHQDAVSIVLGAEAIRQDKAFSFGIEDFRSSTLNNRLLKADEVQAWIAARAEEDGRPSIFKTGSAEFPGRGLRLLAYLVPDKSFVQHQPTTSGGVLEDLRLLSVVLSNFFGWHPASATLFVLTGSVPHVPAIRSTVKKQSPLPVRSRIVMTIDPSSTPAEVSDAYQAVRKEHFGRIRRLNEKHSQLAAFWSQSSGERPSDNDRREWNRQCMKRKAKDWRYDNLYRFTRDCKQALKRLLGTEEMVAETVTDADGSQKEVVYR